MEIISADNRILNCNTITKSILEKAKLLLLKSGGGFVIVTKPFGPSHPLHCTTKTFCTTASRISWAVAQRDKEYRTEFIELFPKENEPL